MKKFIILLLLISCKVFSQDLEYVKAQDTIFIILKESKEIISNKYDDFEFETSGISTRNQYRFIKPDEPELSITTWNKYNRNKTVLRKKFLRKYKNKIIDIEFINKIGFDNFVALINIKRHKFYIISTDDLKNKKIVLKKAIPYSPLFNQM